MPAGAAVAHVAGHLATEFDRHLEALAAVTLSDAERLALYRAALTLLIESMEHLDDSGADVAMVFEDAERTYLALLRKEAAREGLLRDLLELVSWEDYGLFRGVEGFLSTLPEPLADLALRELSAFLGELRREGFEYTLRSARSLRRALLASVQSDGTEEEAEHEEG